MINKMADEASAILLLICSHKVWVKWPMIGPRPCAHASAYVDPVFTCQRYDISISTGTRRTKKKKKKNEEPVRFYLCSCLCASENQA